MPLIGCGHAGPSEVAISRSDHCPFAEIVNGLAISLYFNQFAFWIALFFVLNKRGKCSQANVLPTPWKLLFSLESPLETFPTFRLCRRPAPPFIKERFILADIPTQHAIWLVLWASQGHPVGGQGVEVGEKHGNIARVLGACERYHLSTRLNCIWMTNSMFTGKLLTLHFYLFSDILI